MTFTKQDLNWYADPDVMKISVYKQQTKVFDAAIDDDGNSSSDHQVGSPQSITIDNPGPGLPESGVYKVVIDAPNDTVLTGLATNLHKIVFTGPINPVSNSAAFPGLVNKTQATNVYTNAPSLTARTLHTSTFQTINAAGQSIVLKNTKKPVIFSVPNSSNPVKVTVPQSDIILNGVGYFAFSPDQFFEPSPYRILPITDTTDLSQVDYVLTDYPGVQKLPGGWEIATREFDLSDAVIQEGQLSWMIDAPGLKNNGNTIEVKSIEVTLNKKGWFNH